MLEMSTMYLPINQSWPKYNDSCRNIYNETKQTLDRLLEKTANEACEFKNEKEQVYN